MSNSSEPGKLEALLFQASLGNREHTKKFLDALRASKLFIPERFQDKKLSDAPEYPNEFFNLLGIRGKEHNVIAAFTHPSLIEEWCGVELRCREVPFSELANLIPSDWWVYLNPGQDVEKEFSPWEIKKIAQGDSDIEEVLEDLVSQSQDDLLALHPLAAAEHEDLQLELKNYLAEQSAVKKAYFLKNILDDGDAGKEYSLVLAIFLNSESDSSQLRSEVSGICHLKLMTSRDYRIIIAGPDDQLQHKLFEKFPLLWERAETEETKNTGLVSALKKIAARLKP